ncbi:hypothetical protein TrispH2_002922 [Trichoplax sp. H2]|nr:hypothetical protein TrispH2_002922 [Trichoplax sp. H2]|eukprot:RDD45138.1 hypothetical protein TrispH2_002922 [Trichoplax sp. H2]
MASGRLFGGILIFFALATIGTGITSYSLNAAMFKIYISPLLFDPAWSANFAIVLGIFLLRVRDLTMTSPSEAASLLSLSIMSAVISSASTARLFIDLFENDYNQIRYSMPTGFQIASTLVIDFVSLVIVVKQGKLLSSQEGRQSHRGISKFPLSIVMIITGGIIYGLGLAIFSERFFNFSVISLHFQGVVIFVTGILGLITHKKNTDEMNVWYRVFATLASGVSLSGMVVLVQTLVHYVNNIQDSEWSRADFTVLTLCQAAFIIIGFVTSMLAIDASRFPADDQNIAECSDPINVGILVSGLLASGIAAFMVAIMNFSTYGYIALMAGAMAYTSSRIGYAIQTTKSTVLKHPYLAVNLLTHVETLFSIGLIIFNYIALPFSSSAIIETSYAYNYIFMGISIASMVPITLLTAKAVYESYKEPQESLILDDNPDI